MSKELNEKALEYRYGFQTLYNFAKIINLIIILVSFIISILSVASSILGNKYESQIVFSTFIWGVISIYLENYAATIKKKAADLQEFYDIYVFGILENKNIMYYSEVDYTIINHRKLGETKYYGIDEKELDNDYIINHQKGIIVYDSGMRKIYYNINKIYLILYIIIMIIFSIKMKLDFYNLSLIVIIPSINIFNYLIKNLINLSDEMKQINDIKVDMNSSSIENEANKIRGYQDFIYIKRRNWVMIPNYIYKWYNRHNKIFFKIIKM